MARVLAGSLVAGTLAAAVLAGPALAEEILSPEQARQFVANKLFAFTCFDGSRGSGRIFSDGSVAGSIQFAGTGPIRYARLPVNTIQIRANAVCASVKGIPFEPCFNLKKSDDVSFRGSVSGMGFAYCDFRKHGNNMIMARAHIRPHALHPPAEARAEAVHAEVARAEASPAEVARAEPPKAEPALDLRRSTD
jgi:hypothetical protein